MYRFDFWQALDSYLAVDKSNKANSLINQIQRSKSSILIYKIQSQPTCKYQHPRLLQLVLKTKRQTFNGMNRDE